MYDIMWRGLIWMRRASACGHDARRRTRVSTAFCAAVTVTGVGRGPAMEPPSCVPSLMDDVLWGHYHNPAPISTTLY